MRSSGWCATIRSSRTRRSCGWSAPPSRRSPSIRERTHWNAQTLQPMDPVTLGLCSQIDLDLEVHRAAKEKPIDATAQGATLLPASETTIRPREPEPDEKKPSRRTQRRCGVRQAQADRRRARASSDRLSAMRGVARASVIEQKHLWKDDCRVEAGQWRIQQSKPVKSRVALWRSRTTHSARRVHATTRKLGRAGAILIGMRIWLERMRPRDRLRPHDCEFTTVKFRRNVPSTA